MLNDVNERIFKYDFIQKVVTDASKCDRVVKYCTIVRFVSGLHKLNMTFLHFYGTQKELRKINNKLQTQNVR